jgi:hypothetical protein
MIWFKLIWGALSGGGISGLAKVLFDHLGKLSDNETTQIQAKVGAGKEVIATTLQTGQQAWATRADLLKGLKITQYLIAAALIPPIFHQGCIYFDSSPFPWAWWFAGDWLPSFGIHQQGSWAVFKAPAPYDDREWQMIASLLGIQATVTTVLTGLKMVARR